MRASYRSSLAAFCVAATFSTTAAIAPTTSAADGKTKCENVYHVGDSLSVDLDSPTLIPDEAARLTPQYRSVGAKSVTLDASGGRSIVEEVSGNPNAAKGIESLLGKGARGCWVIMMGVNEAANIRAGSNVDGPARINKVMDLLSGQDVLWATAKTSNPSNAAYADSGMVEFNKQLRDATKRYPNLRISDLAAKTDPAWFSDGIHFTAAGSAARNKLLASDLAAAFPAEAAAATTQPTTAAPAPTPRATAPSTTKRRGQGSAAASSSLCTNSGGGANPDTGKVKEAAQRAVSEAQKTGVDLGIAIGGARNSKPVVTAGSAARAVSVGTGSIGDLAAAAKADQLTGAVSAVDAAELLMSLCKARAGIGGDTSGPDARAAIGALTGDSEGLGAGSFPAAGVASATGSGRAATAHEVAIVGSGSHWFVVAVTGSGGKDARAAIESFAKDLAQLI